MFYLAMNTEQTQLTMRKRRSNTNRIGWGDYPAGWLCDGVKICFRGLHVAFSSM